jgi:multiple sugar transport system substrate-binding protein
MKRISVLIVVVSMVLAACSKAATSAAPSPTATQLPTAAGPVTIRWSIGLGTGTDASQIVIEKEVADDFNKSQDKIFLVVDILQGDDPNGQLSSQIAAGDGPDIVGPVGWQGSNAFHDQWLDLVPYIQSTRYDTSRFDAAMIKSYQTEAGTVGLPFALYPSAIWYITDLFSKAGLNLPPDQYGEQYKMPDGTLVDWNWDTLTRLAKLLTLDSAGEHSGETGFDAAHIVQYGFSFSAEAHVEYWGAFTSNGGQLLVPGGSKGSYQAKIPDAWKTAWKWVYEGMWGAEPYMPSATAEMGMGNGPASGKIAMVEMPSWFLCCMGVQQFDFGAMPIGLDGKVAGRVDADTFRIWKDTRHPAEAFTVLTWLIDTGINKLVVGSPDRAPAYGALPAITSLRQTWMTAQKANFPFIKNWDVLLAGLNYPDVPSAEAFQPEMNVSWDRTGTFTMLLGTSNGLDLAAQEARLETDLTAIYNK